MSEEWRAWLADVIRWARTVEREAEEVADLIIDALSKGVIATTPPDGGT